MSLEEALTQQFELTAMQYIAQLKLIQDSSKEAAAQVEELKAAALAGKPLVITTTLNFGTVGDSDVDPT